MKLMMFKKGSGTALGVVEGDSVIEVGSAGANLSDVIAGGPAALEAVKAAAAKGTKQPLSSVKPALPIARPGKFLCIGLNYALHAAEGGHATPTYPALFPRFHSSLVAAGEPVIRPKESIQLDYEC